MKKLSSALIVLALAYAPLGLAQTAAVPPAVTPPVDPAALKYARHVIAITMSDTSFSAIVDTVVPAIAGPMARGSGLTTDQQAQMLVILSEEMKKSDLSSMREAMAQLYVSELSTTDLKALSDFYDTPAGRHFVEKQSDIGKKSTLIGQVWARNELVPRVVQRAQELVAKPDLLHP